VGTFEPGAVGEAILASIDANPVAVWCAAIPWLHVSETRSPADGGADGRHHAGMRSASRLASRVGSQTSVHFDRKVDQGS